MWPQIFNNTKTLFDLIVCGNSLSAYIAVYSALLNGLKVAWVNSQIENSFSYRQHESLGFDSLAPEGVRYLNHLLDSDEIDKVSLGVFRSVLRGNQYQVFDSILGEGIQLDVLLLKQMLYKKIKEKVTLISEEANELKEVDDTLHVYTQFNNMYKCKWLINAQGKESEISTQEIDYLSEDLWVTRELSKVETSTKNAAMFEQDSEGWRWLAYDSQGHLCTTQWKRQPWDTTSTSSPIENAFNSQWYKRQSPVESLGSNIPRILLTIPTCYRFDPSSGLGITLQIKSAILAARCVSIAENEMASSLSHVEHYRCQIEDSFTEITKGLIPFYQRYGLKFSSI